MSDERKTILWLVSWYPNKFDPFDGDFIQRHARAAAVYHDIHVLFIKQSEEQDREEEMLTDNQGLTEQIIYLPKKNGLVGKVASAYQWWQASRRAARSVVRQKRPFLVHVHVPWKAGLLGLWIKREYKIPFVVTEHWGIYNRVVQDNIHTRSLLFRRLLRKVFQEAGSFASVSRFLAEGVNQTLAQKSYTVIPNVVDTTLFYPGREKYPRFTFLHVSNMVPLKNVEGILTAFERFLRQTGSDAQLILVGNRDRQYVQLAKRMNLLDTAVFFRGEIPYSEVAREMRQAGVFVLNSNMENSPCVIGEALCCGLPVIATRVGGIPELVNEQNSLLVPPGDTLALAGAFQKMVETGDQYNGGGIATEAQGRFSYAAVGKQFHRLYCSFAIR